GRDPVAPRADLDHVEPLGLQHLPRVVVAARVGRQPGGVVEGAGRLLGPGGGDRRERQPGDAAQRGGVGLPVPGRADQSEAHGAHPSSLGRPSASPPTASRPRHRRAGGSSRWLAGRAHCTMRTPPGRQGPVARPLSPARTEGAGRQGQAPSPPGGPMPPHEVYAHHPPAGPLGRSGHPRPGPAILRKDLYTDPQTGAEVRLVSYPAGVVNPAHTHPCGHGLYVLEGDLVTHRGTFGPGTFVWFPEGNVMEHGAGPEADVTVLFVTNKSFRIDYVE